MPGQKSGEERGHSAFRGLLVVQCGWRESTGEESSIKVRDVSRELVFGIFI